MPRPVWKGKPTLNSIFVASVQKAQDIHSKVIKLYRRNVYFTQTSISPLADLNISVYNGYDFFKKIVSDNFANDNIAKTILTREINVTHKAKLSKHAKKNLQLKNNKKRLVASPANKKSLRPKQIKKK